MFGIPVVDRNTCRYSGSGPVAAWCSALCNMSPITKPVSSREKPVPKTVCPGLGPDFRNLYDSIMRSQRIIRSEQASKRRYPEKSFPVLVLFTILLACLVCSSGCIKLVQKSSAADPGSDPGPDAGLTNADLLYQQAPVQPEPPVPGTSDTASFVTDSAPVIPEDPYPQLHAVRLNITPEALREERIPEFTRTYTLAANATGLLVRVDRAPLILTYNVMPQNNCLTNPASCRGSLGHPVQRPHFTITVRDNKTKEIVLEDGYGRKFSSGTNRTLKIYSEGMYHITLSGEFLDIRLGIATGASPLVGGLVNTTAPSGPEVAAVETQDNRFWF